MASRKAARRGWSGKPVRAAKPRVIIWGDDAPKIKPPPDVNRWAGNCAECGDAVERHAGRLVQDGEQWLVMCMKHAPAPPPEPEQPEGFNRFRKTEA